VSRINAHFKLGQLRKPPPEPIPDVVFNAVLAVFVGCFVVGIGCEAAKSL
jgi:hypothetical protein